MNHSTNHVVKNQHVAAVLPDLARDLGWEVQLEIYALFPRWQELFEPEIASCTVPRKVVASVLWVDVENSSWLHQMQYHRQHILRTLNKLLKKSALKDIRFALPEQEKAEKTQTQKIVFIPPAKEEIDAFQQMIESIQHAASREALMGLWYLAQSCRKSPE